MEPLPKYIVSENTERLNNKSYRKEEEEEEEREEEEKEEQEEKEEEGVYMCACMHVT